jgi:glycosyltransferase involved in cell wall biosynthesis
MRILIESPDCNANGGANGAVGFGWARELAHRHDVHVVAYARHLDNPPQPPPPFEIERIPSTRAAKLGTLIDYVQYVRRHRAEIIERVKPHVIHSVEPGGWIGPRALATREFPYVLGPLNGSHGAPRAFSNAVLGSLPVTPVRALAKRGARSIAVQLANEAVFGSDLPTARMLGRRAMRRARAILLATELTDGALPKRARDRTHKIALTGIDLERFRPQPRAPGPFTILYAGRVVPLKCLHLIIGALPRTGAMLRVAGPEEGPEKWYADHCRALAESLGVARRVTWLGALARDELANEYARAHVTCMLSLWESYGMAYVESLACGTPAIALAAGGAPEIVTPDVGWLLRPTSPADVVNELATRIGALERDTDAVERMGARAREVAEQRYDWTRIIDAVEAIYLKVV